MKAHISIAILSLFISAISVSAQDFRIASPDGTLEMTIHNGDKLTYELVRNGKTLIADSPLGFCFKNEDPMDGNFEVLANSGIRSGVEAWKPVVKNRHSSVSIPYRTINIRFGEKSGKFRQLGLEVRMMNDAAAFRYTLFGNMTVGMRYITKELTGFSLPAGADIWKSEYDYYDKAHPYASSQEGLFIKTPVKELVAGAPIELPSLIRLDSESWLAVTEAYADNFPLFHLDAGKPAGDRRMLNVGLTPLYTNPETDICARFDTETSTPWRVIMAADTPGHFIETDVIQSLNPGCAIEDPSWIKAGMSAWDHWWSGEVKMEMPVIKRYIDLASQQKWPYFLLDWTWYGPHTRPDAHITRPAPQVDMPEIIRYAQSKGVKVWVWLRSEDTNNNDAWREAFPVFHDWGVVGVKIDFMDRGDQDMVNWYRRIISACAENKLMLDFHGAYKPDGIERTYPNVMTREGVMGNEYYKFSDKMSPEHNVNLAFTRMIAGPMDVTPGGFLNVRPEDHKQVSPTVVGNTRAAELSKFVIYESPLTVFCDHPDYVIGQPGADFLVAMPTEWDDTRFLGGLPGEYVAIARRNADKWYVGVLGNSEPRELELDLSFIGDGPLAVEFWQDGKKAAKTPTELQHGTMTLKAGSALKVKLAPAGGFVAVIGQ